MISLVFGNPRDDNDAADYAVGKPGEGASYTCFLFPFAYRPIGDPQSDRNKPRYQPQEVDDAERQRRRRYFTRETADVLFERARWFHVLRDDWKKEWQGWRYPGRSKAVLWSGELDVELAPPELILFEWRYDITKGCAPDAFQNGFRLLEAHFPKGQDSSPTLEDLMLFNERFRFWRALFSGHSDLLRPFAGPFGDTSDFESSFIRR